MTGTLARMLLLVAMLSFARDAAAQPASEAPRPDASEAHSLGINLEGVEYPYPVEYLELGADRGADDPETLQRPAGVGPLRMAFMDIRPESPNGRVVVLLHGKNFNGDYWGQTAAKLAKEGYRVVVPDQIGFGKSTKPIGYPFSFHQLAANTAALLDHLGVEQAAVLGHSMGGMLATRFALMYPERTERLVLVNPIGLEDWKRVVPYQSVWDWYQQELQKSEASIREYQLENYYDGKWRAAYDRPVALLAGMTRSPDWPRMAWVQALTYDMIFTEPVVHEFDRLQVPTLLIIGTRDRTALGKNLVEPEVRETLGRYDRLGEQAAEAIPDAKLVELEDVGHLPHLEAYDRFTEPLLEFLESSR